VILTKYVSWETQSTNRSLWTWSPRRCWNIILYRRITSSGMLRRVTLVRTDVRKNLAPPSSWYFVFIRSLRQLLVAANVLSSPIFLTLMMEALSSSETSVLTRATRRNNPEDTILHSHRRKILKSYITLYRLHISQRLQSRALLLHRSRVRPNAISPRLPHSRRPLETLMSCWAHTVPSWSRGTRMQGLRDSFVRRFQPTVIPGPRPATDTYLEFSALK
jgi:hypothetical protein